MSQLTKDNLGGLILAASFTSAFGIYMPSLEKAVQVPGDMLCSINKIDKVVHRDMSLTFQVQVPVLILHGRDDRMMSWYHARRLYSRCYAIL